MPIDYFYMGNAKKCIEIGTAIVEYGNKHSITRSLSLGYLEKGLGYFIAGDALLAERFCKKAIEVSIDPFYKTITKYGLAMLYFRTKQINLAKPLLEEMTTFSSTFGCKMIGDYCLSCFRNYPSERRANVKRIANRERCKTTFF